MTDAKDKDRGKSSLTGNVMSKATVKEDISYDGKIYIGANELN